jgi:chemotaxis protein CheX
MSVSCTSVGLLAIANNILESVLSAAVVPPDANSRSVDFEFSGCIPIAGAWKGAVILDTSREFGKQAAAIMFNLQPNGVQTQDTIDTVAELTNMFGGNIKPLLPGSSFLSLPAVTTGGDYRISIPNAQLEDETVLNSTIGYFRISIWQYKNELDKSPKSCDTDVISELS